VRKLAEKSKLASKEISAVMETLRREAGEMLADAAAMGEAAQDSGLQAAGMEQRFVAMADSARSALAQIAYVHDVVFMSLAKVDMLHYKQSGYIGVTDGEQIGDAQKVIAIGVHDCRFGRWYDAQAAQGCFGELSSCREIAGPHGAVHANLQQALELSGSDWEKDAALRQAILEKFRAAEAASAQVFALQDQMIEQMHTQRNGAR
jgi:hypothetical protein